VVRIMTACAVKQVLNIGTRSKYPPAGVVWH
jgi:hypothetical protein